jgi:hypothetical protein
MPALPVTDPLRNYQTAQTAFGNWKADRRNTVTFRDYAGNGQFGPSQVGVVIGNMFCPYATLGIYAQTLEKSGTLAQSGSPISAARDLNAVFGSNSLLVYNDPTMWNNLSADVFVPYVSLCTVFLDSVLIRS